MSAATYQLRKLLKKFPSAEEIIYGQDTVPDARNVYYDAQQTRGAVSTLLRKAISDARDAIKAKEQYTPFETCLDCELQTSDYLYELHLKETLEDINAYSDCLEILDNKVMTLLNGLNKRRDTNKEQ